MRTLLSHVLFVMVLVYHSFLWAGDIAGIPANDMHLDKFDMPAPIFKFANGESLETYKGKWVMLHFWATWCVPCKRELPALSHLYDHMKDNPHFALIAISIDNSDTEKNVPAYIKQLGLDLPVHVLSQTTISDDYWSWGVPVTYFINPQGHLVARAMGERAWDSPATQKFVSDLVSSTTLPESKVSTPVNTGKK